MATIALNANGINQMPTMIKKIKQSVAEYKSELFSLKMQMLTINQSICNLDEVVDSIQASTKTQEDKMEALDDWARESEQFISDVVHIDGKVADEINQRRDKFYEDYYYLKPECERNWIDKTKDALISAAEWCKENWQSIAKLAVAVVVIAVLGVLSVVTGGVLATILAGAFFGALFGALISGVTGGLSTARNGGSFFEGFADGVLSGAVSGALTGAAFAGVGIAGSALGQFLGGACRFAENAGKILKVFECTSKITGVISFGMGAFDTAAMVVGFFNPDSPLVKLNEKLHASSLYNGFQIAVTITAIFTGAAYASMRERMKFPPTCFIAGTLILTAGGLVAIENIKAGDRVIATNPDTFETEEKSVIETYVNKTSQLIHLSIHDEIITTTWNHPFYVKEKGFVNAEELQVGDQIVGADGETYLVENHQVEIVEIPETVYNFQVEDFHTYHVGNAGVLVHNADCGKTKGDNSGIVEFKAPPDATPEQIKQVKAYTDGCNEALRAGKLSSTGKVSTKGSLRRQASRAARKEAKRASNAGTPYKGHVGHVPDTTWTGSPEPFKWLDLDSVINTSLGGQSNKYPTGYKPTGFIFKGDN